MVTAVRPQIQTTPQKFSAKLTSLEAEASKLQNRVKGYKESARLKTKTEKIAKELEEVARQLVAELEAGTIDVKVFKKRRGELLAIAATFGIAIAVFANTGQKTTQQESAFFTPQPQVERLQESTTSEKPGEVQFLQQAATPEKLRELFSTPNSPGNRMIGAAEGNYTIGGKRTQNWYGHVDPGNNVKNQGFCSDQGRGGGDPHQADKACVRYISNRLNTVISDFLKAGINTPSLEESVNAIDLYNQANPRHSKLFPSRLKHQKKIGKSGVEAIAAARAATFWINGKNTARGLIRACRNRRNWSGSEWDCVYQDQMRRVEAINKVLLRMQSEFGAEPRQTPSYLEGWSARDLAYPKLNQTISGYRVSSLFGTRRHPITGRISSHGGVDVAAPIGTPVVAPASGTLKCWINGSMTTKGGLVATLRSPEIPNVKFNVLHLSKCKTAPGDSVQVRKGEIIGNVGSSGASTGPHAHFEVVDGGGQKHNVRRGWIKRFLGEEVSSNSNEAAMAYAMAMV